MFTADSIITEQSPSLAIYMPNNGLGQRSNVICKLMSTIRDSSNTEQTRRAELHHIYFYITLK